MTQSVTHSTDAPSRASPHEGEALPTLATHLAARDVVQVATRLSKAGKLPGFTSDAPDCLFVVDAHASPFDHALMVRAEEAPGGGSTLRFLLRLRRGMALVFLLICLVVVWPGVWLTHQMLGLYFDWYRWSLWQTCLWYLPVMVGPLPWLGRRALRKSRAEARASAMQVIEVLSRNLGAAIQPASADAATEASGSRSAAAP